MLPSRLRMGCQQKIYDFAVFDDAFEHFFIELQLVFRRPAANIHYSAALLDDI